MSHEPLDDISARVERGETPTVSVRTLLGWFGAQRRGTNVINGIRRELRSRKLRTVPDFAEVWIDADVAVESTLARANGANGTPVATPASPLASPPAGEGGLVAPKAADAIHRILLLESANRGVVSVAPGAPIAVAITKMLLHDFSQLPVMQNSRTCRGAVTWQGIAKQKALGHELGHVDDCLEPVQTLDADTSLLDAIPHIVASGFVLVRGADKNISGIITTADLSVQFQTLSEPFILLGQIENLLRRQIQASFTLAELQAARNPAETGRTINEAADLTFGEYVRLLEQPEKWTKLGLSVDRAEFLLTLHKVHEIRNDVMHFHPDPLENEELTTLRDMARFLELITVDR